MSMLLLALPMASGFGKPAANVIGFPGGHFSFGAGRNFDRFKLRDQPMILSAELR